MLTSAKIFHVIFMQSARTQLERIHVNVRVDGPEMAIRVLVTESTSFLCSVVIQQRETYGYYVS